MKFYLTDYTPEEYHVIVKALAERMKNIVFMSAERRALEVLDSLKDDTLDPDGRLTIDYKINFLWNDVIEILGGLKRK